MIGKITKFSVTAQSCTIDEYGASNQASWTIRPVASAS
jgi:hypothetical protein